MGTLRASKLDVTGEYSPGLLGPQVCQDERRGEQSALGRRNAGFFHQRRGSRVPS